MKTYSKNILSLVIFALVISVGSSHAQYLLQAPNDSDQNNYRWFEASDTSTVLGTEFFYEVTQPGVYFATYDGTICGSNATGYFIVTDCNSPNNEVILDISASVSGSATVSWNNPSLTGTQPTVLATETVERYVATIQKAGNSISLPRFTVVCMRQAADLEDDIVTLDEDDTTTVSIFINDSNLPSSGTLTFTDPTNGVVTVDNNGTPNDPTDDVVTYTPNPDFNGTDSFEYTVCNTVGDCSTATVTATVVPIVDTFDDSVTAIEAEATTIPILANDNDLPTNGSLVITMPSNGIATIDNNGTSNDPSDDVVIYTSNLGFTGTDSFEYTLCDNDGNCSTSIVTVLVNPSSNLDSDNDGIVDLFEDLNLDGDFNPDTDPTDNDNDGIPDYLDIDSDNDGIPDNVEAQEVIDYINPSGIDANSNGLDDVYENNGNVGLLPIDTDGDGIPDYVDTDSDNDTVPDATEAHDFDQDGFPDVTPNGNDTDGDGLDDGYEGGNLNDIDVNDQLDNPEIGLPDSDEDNTPDFRDLDDDNDGIETLDEDLNEDGDLSNDDSDEDGIPNYLDPDLISTGTEIQVVQILTPNDDGNFDTLFIENIQNYPNNTVKIYNRWGVLVFKTSAYDNEANNFDGKSTGRVTVSQDSKLPSGTYFYIIDFEDETNQMKQLSGYIYINR